RDEQEHGSNLERQQVVAVQDPRDRLRVAGDFSAHRAKRVEVLGQIRKALGPEDVQKRQQKNEQEEERDVPLVLEREPFADASLVDEHDDEEEQHHDPAGVDEDLDGPDELCLLQEEDAGDQQEGREQEKRGV